MSRTATKARKANALIDTLEKLDRSEVLDGLALARLAREAQGLMKSDPAGAHMVLGGIAGIEGDVTRVCKHHEIALELSGRSSQTLTNYAAALINVGEMFEAFTTIMEAHERARGNPRVLKSAVGIAMQSAEFRRSHVLYQRWNMLRPQKPREDEELMKAACEAIDRGAFSEEAARKVVRLAAPSQGQGGSAIRRKRAGIGVWGARQVRTRHARAHVTRRSGGSERSIRRPSGRRRRTPDGTEVELRADVHGDKNRWQ